MKMITVVIQPFMLGKLTHVLEAIPEFPGMTIVSARGFGREKAAHHDQPHGRMEDIVEHVQKTRIEIVAPDRMTTTIVQAIAQFARTGNPGDGEISVSTGEKDDERVGGQGVRPTGGSPP